MKRKKSLLNHNFMKRKRLYPSLLIILVIGLVAMYVNCSYVPVFNGIDISHHNRVDWKKIKALLKYKD